MPRLPSPAAAPLGAATSQISRYGALYLSGVLFILGAVLTRRRSKLCDRLMVTMFCGLVLVLTLAAHQNIPTMFWEEQTRPLKKKNFVTHVPAIEISPSPRWTTAAATAST